MNEEGWINSVMQKSIKHSIQHFETRRFDRLFQKHHDAWSTFNNSTKHNSKRSWMSTKNARFLKFDQFFTKMPNFEVAFG